MTENEFNQYIENMEGLKNGIITLIYSSSGTNQEFINSAYNFIYELEKVITERKLERILN